ncbi:hypothetical protein RvY_01733 [Ramazzottius varieornatus]|uniref:Uncharacterized protein n=1 Tax=Ramazzottius varieornatus TaxID=947166 RepID=A0A1D1UHF9_RAMVA|nr:hypothetical protein RvY_01733 [Ramazzottius varieornatus]
MNLRWSFGPSVTFVCFVLYSLSPAQGADPLRNMFSDSMMALTENVDSTGERDNFGAALTDSPSLSGMPDPSDLSNSAVSNSDNNGKPLDGAFWTAQTYFPSARSSWNPEYSDWVAQNQQGGNDMWSGANMANEDDTSNYNPWGSHLHTYYKTHHKRGEDSSLRLRFGRSGVRLRFGRSGPPTLRFG